MKIKKFISTAAYETASFWFGIFIGINAGFILAFFYIFMPWGSP